MHYRWCGISYIFFRVRKVYEFSVLPARGLKMKTTGKYLKIIKIKSKVNNDLRNVIGLTITKTHNNEEFRRTR